jgi:hypothetical protein
VLDASFFSCHPDGGGNKHLGNVGKCLPQQQQPRRQPTPIEILLNIQYCAVFSRLNATVEHLDALQPPKFDVVEVKSSILYIEHKVKYNIKNAIWMNEAVNLAVLYLEYCCQ